MPTNIIVSRGAEGPGQVILQRPPSVCLSAHPSVCTVRPSRSSFRNVTQNASMYFRDNFADFMHRVMGVYCIVFDIDAMLFSFFMIFYHSLEMSIDRGLILSNIVKFEWQFMPVTYM